MPRAVRGPWRLLPLLLLAGCLARPIVRPPEAAVRSGQDRTFTTAIVKGGLAGDWIVTRGYHASDVLVANATGIPLSHVGVYDPDRGEVIEAESPRVHATPLPAFVHKSDRVILIRPRWSSPTTGTAAIEEARALIGKRYDFLGTVGLDVPGRYYCSELAVEIYRRWWGPTDRMPPVIKPGELYLFGSVLYDSGDRE